MKFKYLGTAAAEGIPAIFCDCENCKKSRRLGGRNIRTRSQALIDDELLIDFPCDTYYHTLFNNIDLMKVKHCLITHIHIDHLYPLEFLFLKSGFSHPDKNWSLNIYGSVDVEKVVEEYISSSNGFLKYKKVNTYQPFRIDNYSITALKAWHGTDNPYIYLISDGGKTILYAHDTDVLPEQTWGYLRDTNIHLDFVSMDCTQADDKNLEWHGHMCLERNIECKRRMEEYGLIDDNTTLVLNHFSHNGSICVYDEFYPLAKEYGFEVSYDGMEIVI